jgi:hypothetical protein
MRKIPLKIVDKDCYTESEISNYIQRWKEPKLATRIEWKGRICRCIALPNDRDAPTVITQHYIIRPWKISHPTMVHATTTPFLTLHAASKMTMQHQERGNTTSTAIRSRNVEKSATGRLEPPPTRNQGNTPQSDHTICPGKALLFSYNSPVWWNEMAAPLSSEIRCLMM